MAYVSGEKHHNWKGGRSTTGNGYMMVLAPGHKYASQRGYVLEHRYVMEKHIGRYLEPHEHVHHINGNKLDNRIENLVVISHLQHIRNHVGPKGAKWQLLDDEKWMEEQLNNGRNNRQIGKTIGCSEFAVAASFERLGIKAIRHGPQKVKFKELRDKQWIKEKSATMSQTEIARLLGCDRELVRKFQKAHGIVSYFKSKPGPKTKQAQLRKNIEDL